MRRAESSIGPGGRRCAWRYSNGSQLVKKRESKLFRVNLAKGLILAGVTLVVIGVGLWFEPEGAGAELARPFARRY